MAPRVLLFLNLPSARERCDARGKEESRCLMRELAAGRSSLEFLHFHLSISAQLCSPSRPPLGIPPSVQPLPTRYFETESACYRLTFVLLTSLWISSVEDFEEFFLYNIQILLMPEQKLLNVLPEGLLVIVLSTGFFGAYEFSVKY
ncbi:hypothetical protein CEXT_642171 [Caerostris extrusa]|uniref:Uncharacterized protein n=1 Tax=Caerostris extrusa TaxID=172846 RepID=A0AAV4WGN3_CAEEX|nr:hypothetical protein CEXT_642171 [Caerostris extrusa]